MTYKCSECGCEYETKTDFCDCGNDEFIIENIAETKPVNNQTESIQQQVKTENNFQQIKQEKEIETFAERYPEMTRFFKSIDPISGGIFGLCIILSLIVVFCLWNVDENNITSPQPSPQGEGVIAQNIPSIDKIWNNTPPSIPKEEIQQEEIQPAKVVQQVVKQIVPVNKTVPSKPQTKKNTNAAAPKAAKVNTVVQKTTNKTTQQTKTTPQTTVKPTENKPVEKPIITQNITQQPQKSEAQIAAENAQKAASEKREFENYKVSLRNTIGRKIDFTRVIGDGDCTVAFKIDTSGKLVSRSFAKQSSNITLNDVVYAAVMSTPTYNPPPAGYKNETLNLSIKFYNGNFEISLK